jgi:hypothetical protein
MAGLVLLMNPALQAAELQTLLSVRVQEAGKPAACRSWVMAGHERLFRPITPGCTPYERDRSFSSVGEFVIPVKPGRVMVHVERGKEYLPVDREVTAEAGRTTELVVPLKRWIDMRGRGWYSADMHVHFIHEDRRVKTPERLESDLRVLKQMALADDVNLVPVFSYWNDNLERWPDWPGGSSVRADDTHLVTLANEEIERIAPADGPAWESVGAPLFYGLTRPVHVPRMEKTYPPDAVLCRLARESSPDCLIDMDKALWAENVVGVALGLFDSMQLCHNHYHRDKTFRMGWGMIGPDFEEKRENWDHSEMLHRTNLLYYHWLNCGFRLAATGGSAIGVMPVPTGYSRTYARLKGPLSEKTFLEATRLGKTFATTGPMLFLTASGHEVGDTIEWSQGSAPVKVRVELQSAGPIESLDLIHNGVVLASTSRFAAGADPVITGVLESELGPRRSGWIAARAMFRCADRSLHQAHTSPIYLRVDGKPIAFRKDAEVMLRWIDRILEVSAQPGRYRSEPDRQEAGKLLGEARRVYEGIAQTARSWPD